MTRRRLTHVMVVFLGLLYVAAGIAETVRLVRSGEGGFAFWFGSLVGGGSLVLAGEALRHRHRRLSIALIGVGAVAGVLATAWTLVVPVLAVVTAVLALARMEDEAAPSEPTATGLPPGSDAP
jgi:hypothetical protein